MPNVVRLPAHVSDDEVRVYWDVTDEGADLNVWGPRSARFKALSIFTEEPIEFADPDELMTARLQSRIKAGRSPLTVLKALGYDPRTLVFSIRKLGAPAPPAEVPDDIRKRLEDAQTAVLRLKAALTAGEEVKDVTVFDSGDIEALNDAVWDAESSVAAAMDLLDGRPLSADGT